jgi:3-oxoacyl-[acyl-carrier protein] reductase
MDSRRVLITGASRGLGLAISQGMAAAGHTVFGCSRSAEMTPPLLFHQVRKATQDGTFSLARSTHIGGAADDTIGKTRKGQAL